ncbi:MAG: S8 family serine peptidase [Ignavibacteriales bacterium]|nr:S8 family serine peptidase [Ignavibacteriales bacterium]
MKFNPILFLASIIFIAIPTLAQTTYFIKYKSNVPISVVESNVLQKILSNNLGDAPLALPTYDVNYLAKGLGRGDEVLGRIVKVQFSEIVQEANFNTILSSEPDIEYIQKSNTYRLDFVPNDSLLSEQWALEKIKAFDAWDITQGSDTVLLAIIDTGIDYLHPDLMNKIYKNPGESGIKSNNGIDDDDNGFIDDYMGWDFVDRVGFPFDSTGGDYLTWDNIPLDEHGHGTLVSGTFAAETNNISGIAGVAPKINILNLRSFDPGGYGEEDDAAAAILYAVKMGAKVINMSWGDYSFSYVLRDVIRYAYSQNVVLVASSGNNGSNVPHYPSGYSEVISIGNSTEQDFVAGSSNWGSTLDLVAPGSGITSTALNSDYSSFSGTSASAPFVSAAAALILSKQSFTNEEVKQILKSTSDDIGEAGWDLRSGAGRLNLFKALTVTAPAIVKFNYPTQDYATFNNDLPISVTVLSPYFISFNLEFGIGLNPDAWTTLIEERKSQAFNEEVFNLNLANFIDTSYTIRLIVFQNNGRTAEERVNFHIDRTPPITDLVNLIPAFYGNKSVPLAAIYTDDPSTVRMFYRKTGDSNFNFVTLDGFSTNNQFVKQLHYGFIPKDLVIQNTFYEIYFEAENLAGLITTKNNIGSNYFVSTSFNSDLSPEYILPYTLPAGDLYEDPMNITSNQFSDVSLRQGKDSHLFNFSNDSFILIDTLDSKYVKGFGDFNNNGLADLLTYFTYDGFIDEQSYQFSSTFIQKYSVISQDGGVRFWPIMAKDVDSDGTVEVFSIRDLNRVEVWDVQPNLSLLLVDSLMNFTPLDFGNNRINSPGAAIADMDGDGINEFWMVDEDGDIFSYDINTNNNFTTNSVIRTGFLGSSSYITSGDYDGDGKTELAVLLHSINQLDIVPFYRLIVFNISDSTTNILYDQAFFDASTEFSGAFRKTANSLRFADINNDNKDELLLYVFPYAYIFKNDLSENKIIAYKENINSNSVFVGDLNQNGVLEVGFPYSNKIEFSEFATSNYLSTPNNFSGFSINSSTIQLNWNSNAPKFYIYKGLSISSLELIDSTSIPNYFDSNINLDSTYYYAVKAFDASKPESLSGMSSIVDVFAHTPAKPDSAYSNSNRSVIVTFSEKMKNTIENLQAFNILGVGYPNSVTANDQYSYLLSYTTNLPAGNQKLIIQDIKDLFNSPIETDSLNFTVTPKPEEETFYVTSFEIINAYKIKLVFNFNVDVTSALNPNNYTFEPSNKVSLVSIDPNDSKIIYLDLTSQKPVGSIGKEYVLRINNLVSNTATGSIAINTGSGSYVVLSTYAKDLSDVYVYPNPTKESTEKVTFANLPQRAKITIWTIDGTMINEIEETDGNGGVDFNLVDFSGNKIATGVYIYRVVQLDSANNEGEEKLGKFAIVR